MTTPNPDKVRENRLRAALRRQGLELRKSRRRDPLALDYGRYYLVDPAINGLLDEASDLDQVEAWTNEGRKQQVSV
jgi:hypothetical protein